MGLASWEALGSVVASVRVLNSWWRSPFCVTNVHTLGQQSENVGPGEAQKGRLELSMSLQLLAVLCFVQVVIGRAYIIERSRGSEMMVESPLSQLSTLQQDAVSFDQCYFEAKLKDEVLISESTNVDSHVFLPEFEKTCDGTHEHIHLGASNRAGLRTTQSVVFPKLPCTEIVAKAQALTMQGANASAGVIHEINGRTGSCAATKVQRTNRVSNSQMQLGISAGSQIEFSGKFKSWSRLCMIIRA